MIVGYRKDTWDVLRAAICVNRETDVTLLCGKDEKDLEAKFSRYPDDYKVKVWNLIPQVPMSVKMKLRETPPKLGGRCQPSLHAFISYGLRHRQCVPDDIVKLLAQYYPDIGQVLAHKDAQSKKLYRMQFEVLGELHRMRAHTRPVPAGNLMYVEISPEHYVIDLYLEWIAKRVNDRASVVKAHRDYYLANASYLGYDRQFKEISQETAKSLTGEILKTDNSAWEQYYDSQAIENRRNKAFAQKMLPKKVASLSPEVKLEREKIEHGIPRCDLTSFFNLKS